MLNQASKRLMSACFSKKINLYQNQKSYLCKNLKFFLFEAGKYDVNKDYYAILGIDKQSADQSLIKKQYYKLAKQYHPDVNPSASQKFKLINEAYGVLSDQKLKSEYDEARGSSQARQRFDQKRNQYNSQQDYRAQYYKQYRRAYQQMDEYDRYLIKKQFSRMLFRMIFFGFAFTLFSMALFGGPRRVFVDQFGRPVDVHGRPLDKRGNPIQYQGYPSAPIYDPYGLGGAPKNAYPNQSQYGRQYTGQSPVHQPLSGQNTQNYY